jgi:hypothetical protein
MAAVRRYTPGHFAGHVALFLPSREWAHSADMPLHWQSVAQSAEQHFGPDDCDGDVMLREPYAPVFAELLARCTAKET